MGQLGPKRSRRARITTGRECHYWASQMEQINTLIRHHVYRHFIDVGSPPTVEETARALDLAVGEVERAYRRLDEDHALVLTPGALRIWMAMPLSAVSTAFRVRAGEQSWWANCAWDALGIPAMLGRNARVVTTCGDCDEPMTLTVEEGALVETEGVVHFAVPAAKWWDDVGFT